MFDFTFFLIALVEEPGLQLAHHGAAAAGVDAFGEPSWFGRHLDPPVQG